MPFSNEILIRIIIFVLAFFGFWVAKHIRDHKTKNTPLVCMIGFDCHTVVHSDYSKFFGMPVEILGMTYYAFTTVTYLAFVIQPELLSYTYIPILSTSIMLCISLVGFLFSAYLIAVQILILRKGCSWCIVSAFVCFCIFILTAFLYHFTLVTQIFI